jgi:anti-sigma factor RsiW
MSTKYQTPSTYDEVTFALYFDQEMDQQEEARFEAALKADSALMKRYNDWVSVYEHFTAHFESLETHYQLDGFTDAVMSDLPAEWDHQRSGGSWAADDHAESHPSWTRRILAPFLIGSMIAAALFIVFKRVHQAEPNTDQQTIDQQFGEDFRGLTPISAEEGPTWLKSDAEEEDESAKGGGI